MNETVQVDELLVTVKRSARRKHAALTIDRTAVLSSPSLKTHRHPTSFVSSGRSRFGSILPWTGKTKHSKSLPAKEFVSGEGFFCLGRKYRLKIVRPGSGQGHVDALALKNDYFFLPAHLAADGRQVFIKCYTSQASEWISKRLKAFKSRVAAEPQSLEIRDLGYRWASCTVKGKMFFHWRAILLPPEHLDYLILHELIHLHEHNHGPAFYERLHRACSNYKTHEDWLRRNGSLYTL